MNIKRALISLLAAMIFPAVASAQIEIIPEDGTAVLAIQKIFTDGNNITPVTLNLQCTNGQPNQSSVTVFPEDQAGGPFGQFEVTFVIDNIALVNDEGATCTVTETPVAGYETAYSCRDRWADSTPDDNCRPTPGSGLPADNYACMWSDIQSSETNGDEVGDVNRCLITNAPEYVPVTVTKTWDITNSGGDFFDRTTTITIACDAEIDGGTERSGLYYVQHTFQDADFVSDGSDSYTAEVFPKFPDGTNCFAIEYNVDSAVEEESTCGTAGNPGMKAIKVGGSGSCELTNTLFFEGIPTLSQYGMAIMALLMLGVGFIGFRRFI